MEPISRSKVFCTGSLVLALTLGCACGRTTDLAPSSSETDSRVLYRETGWSENAVRVIFHQDHFTDLSDFSVHRSTDFRCLGDAHRFFKVDGEDYRGSPTAFDSASGTDYFLTTHRPAFLKAVSVEITRTYYPQTVSNTIQSDHCSYRGIASAAQPSQCADFDRSLTVIPTPTVAPTATPSPTPEPTPTPAPDRATGYYRVRDPECVFQGPLLGSDLESSKAYVGGVSIDLDRAELGESEDLLMIVTYHSLNSNASWPSAQSVADHTVLQVKLVQTGLDGTSLLTMKQPRAWSSFLSSVFPVHWEKVATLEDSWGSLRSDSVYVPLSKNPLIDRIRLERVRGSYFLFQIDLYRLGNRS